MYTHKKKTKPSMVQMVGDSNQAQAPVHGKQRIYSRQDTQTIVTMATSAAAAIDYLKLGKFVYQATKAQDAKEPEYTDD